MSRRADLSLVLVDVLSPDRRDEALAAVTARKNVHYRQMDLTDLTAVNSLPRDIDTILHLAALIGVEHVQRSPDRVLEVNALSTLNIFNYATTLNDLRRVLFSSTSEVYAGTLRHHGIEIPTSESVSLCLDDLSAPRTSYALSKIFGEGVAFAWRRTRGVPITIVRYHNVFGPRMGFRHVIPETFVKIARADARIQVPSANHTRAFCYIEDAVEATIRCAEASSTEGQLIHIGSSREEIAVRDLVQRVAVVMGRSVTIEELPETPGSPVRRCPDVRVLARLTGFHATVSLEDGLRRTYAWYRERLPVH